MRTKSPLMRLPALWCRRAELNAYVHDNTWGFLPNKHPRLENIGFRRKIVPPLVGAMRSKSLDRWVESRSLCDDNFMRLGVDGRTIIGELGGAGGKLNEKLMWAY